MFLLPVLLKKNAAEFQATPSKSSSKVCLAPVFS